MDVVGNGDDPAGVSFTYFDYPAAFAGFANQDSEYVNDDSANRWYTSYEVELNRRYGNNWQFRASFSATKKTEPFGTSDNVVIAGLDPNAEINSGYDGLLEWEFRTAASYLFRYGILAVREFRPPQRRVLGAECAVQRSGWQPDSNTSAQGRTTGKPAG